MFNRIFVTMLMAWAMLGEAMNRWQILGLVVAFAGIAIIGANIGGDMPFWGFVFLLIAGFGWSAGNIANKQLSHLSAMTLVVWGGVGKFGTIRVVANHRVSCVVRENAD